MGKFLVVVAGPTGVGKTAMAIRLAEALGSEVISADSRQVYREMRIGTARPSTAELAAVPHHLIAHRSVHEQYNAAAYAHEARAIVENLFQRKDATVICGGSGLYIRAIMEGLDQIPEIPPSVRQRTITDFQHYGPGWLKKEVEKCDPEWFSQADQENHRRLLRCLEVFRATEKPLSSFQSGNQHPLPYPVLRIALQLPRPILYDVIDRRVTRMMEEGLWEEAESLFPIRHLQALHTVGYQEIFDALEGKTTREEAIRLIQQHTRNYAKRQMTWFRADPNYHWFSPQDESGILTWIGEQRARIKG